MSTSRNNEIKYFIKGFSLRSCIASSKNLMDSKKNVRARGSVAIPLPIL